jgi:hypothetical protein
MHYLFLFSFEQISGQLKSLQIVASLTAERDGEIRKAALNTLALGYKILGMPWCLNTTMPVMICHEVFVMYIASVLMISACIVFIIVLILRARFCLIFWFVNV